MRISVTDRCNLRCQYCTGCTAPFIPHADILRYEEILTFLSLAKPLGVEKVRFTGGEPFVRKGFTSFLERVAEQFPEIRLAVTTNGTLIGKDIERLAAAGVKRVNISLDTLREDRFESITGTPHFKRVIKAVDQAIEAGLHIKINAVAMRGMNDDELPDFLELARTRAIDVRFIEFMPVGDGSPWSPETVWKASDIVEQAAGLADLAPVDRKDRKAGPARMFTIDGGPGRLGIISPYTNHFCDSCNRLRLTSDGRLRTCLFSDRTYRLRPSLRHPKLGPETTLRIMRRAVNAKPLGHELLKLADSRNSVCHTAMASIGG